MDGCGQCGHLICRGTGCKGSAGCRTSTVGSSAQTALGFLTVVACFQIAKARDVGIEVQLDGPDRAVTLLGDDDFGNVG